MRLEHSLYKSDHSTFCRAVVFLHRHRHSASQEADSHTLWPLCWTEWPLFASRHAMANCFEALLGAIFLDGGIDVADRIFSDAMFGSGTPEHLLIIDIQIEIYFGWFF